MPRKKIRKPERIYKTKPKARSDYGPVDVARNAPQARRKAKECRKAGSGYYVIIVKTGKQGKVHSGSMKGASRLTYTIYAKEKKR